jgi:hypothetical protein
MGVMFGAEIQSFEDCDVLVIDLGIIRVMFEWGTE